jgi:hypothetical protein
VAKFTGFIHCCLVESERWWISMPLSLVWP